MDTKTKNTELLLSSISKRLHGRQDCSGKEYIVKIHGFSVEMFPHVLGFPDNKSRKEVFREPLLFHVMRSKFGSLECRPYRDESSEGWMLVPLGTFVDGIYKYTISFGGKRRKWIRIK